MDDDSEAMHQNIPAETSFPGLGNGAVLQCDSIQVFTLLNTSFLFIVS